MLVKTNQRVAKASSRPGFKLYWNLLLVDSTGEFGLSEWQVLFHVRRTCGG